MVMRTIHCCVVLTLHFLFTIRMFYFNGGFLIFQNEERTADWCDSPGNPCFDCRGITDVTIYEQCSDRIMCPVLAEKLMGLTFSVRNCFENSESTCQILSKYCTLLCWISWFVLPKECNIPRGRRLSGTLPFLG